MARPVHAKVLAASLMARLLLASMKEGTFAFSAINS
jgi:hypothetical protein